MNERWELTTSRREVGDEMFTRLKEEVGDRAIGDFLSLKTTHVQAACRRAVGLLDQYGFVRWTDKCRDLKVGSEYVLDRYREYDPADLSDCAYLSIDPISYITPNGMGKGGIYWNLFLNDPHGGSNDVRHAKFIANLGYGATAVSSEAKRLIEEASLIGAMFRPTELVRSKRMAVIGPIPWSEYGDPWWELTSTIKLPPVSPYLRKHDNRGNTLPREAVHARIEEQPYDDVELHYLKSELTRVEPFDVACCYESVAPVLVVVSNRFYRMFVEKGIKCNWRPVRIDEG